MNFVCILRFFVLRRFAGGPICRNRSACLQIYIIVRYSTALDIVPTRNKVLKLKLDIDINEKIRYTVTVARLFTLKRR